MGKYLEIKIETTALLEEADGDHVRCTCDTDLLGEHVDGLCCVSLSPERVDGAHPFT